MEWRVRYHVPDDSGFTRAQRNENFNKAHLTPEEPEIPEEVLHLVEWFHMLSASRRISEAGPMGLAPSDVLAWCTLSGVHMLPSEYEILTRMDAAYLTKMYEHREAQRAKYQADQKPKPTERKKAKS